MSIEWQRTMTPFKVLGVQDARGCVPKEVTTLLGGGDEKYYFKNNYGKVFLVKNHNVKPPIIGAVAAADQKMKDARIAWKGLSQSEKETWGKHKFARARNIPGRAAFISYFIRDKI